MDKKLEVSELELSIIAEALRQLENGSKENGMSAAFYVLQDKVANAK